jgi:hypothetical protein
MRVDGKAENYGYQLLPRPLGARSLFYERASHPLRMISRLSRLPHHTCQARSPRAPFRTELTPWQFPTVQAHDFTNLADHLNPAVVNISTTQVMGGHNIGPNHSLLRAHLVTPLAWTPRA